MRWSGMTGIVSGIDYSALLGGGSSASSLLSTILNGAGTPARTAAASNPIVALKLAQTNQTKDIAAEAKDPQVATDIAAFKKALSGAKTIQSALSNPAILKVLLTANGLGEQLAYTGLAAKALMSDPTDSKSLANQLSSTNAQWLAVAKTFNFAKNGLSALSSASVQGTLANGYAEVKWRESLDSSNPGMSNALTFLDQASSIKDVDQILGDSTNRDVVLTALNIPLQIAYQPLATQEQAIKSRLDISKLQDPKFVQTFVQRYLLNKDVSATSSSTTSGALSLLA